MRRFYLILLTLFAVTLTATAQKLVAGAPSHVSVGEQFRLTYTINTQDVDNFRAGNFPDAFEVLMGPSTSRQSSFQMVNGHTTSSSSSAEAVADMTTNRRCALPEAIFRGQTSSSR